jgi:hypothetical protein
MITEYGKTETEEEKAINFFVCCCACVVEQAFRLTLSRKKQLLFTDFSSDSPPD